MVTNDDDDNDDDDDDMHKQPTKEIEVNSMSSSQPLMVVDPVEVSVGITTYLSPTVAGFSAVTKARYSDFVVHEVGMDGSVARLESLDPVILSSSTEDPPKDMKWIPNENEHDKQKTKEKDDEVVMIVAGADVLAQHERMNDNNKDTSTDKLLTDCDETTTTTTGWNMKKRKHHDVLLVEETPAIPPTTTTTTTISFKPTNHSADDVPQQDWFTLQSELAVFVGVETAQQVMDFLNPQPPKQQQHVVGSEEAAAAQTQQQQQFVKLPHMADKDKRRQLHHWIRQRLNVACGAMADTVDEDDDNNNNNNNMNNKVIRIWHRTSTRQMPNFKAFARREQQQGGAAATSKKKSNNNNRHRRPYLQFVLYKENMDTQTALQQLQRRYGGGRGGRGRGGGGRAGRGRGGGRGGHSSLRLGFAGNKDKRGITSQFITVPSAQDQHIMTSLVRTWNYPPPHHNNNNHNHKDDIAANAGGGHTSSSGGAILRVGSFRYVDHELRLGRLFGNRFDVVMRNVSIVDVGGHGQKDDNTVATTEPTVTSKQLDFAVIQQQLAMAVQSIRDHGFINYFGMQRFGKSYDTHLTGIAILKGDYTTAIDIIMRPKTDEREEIYQARLMWQRRFGNLPECATKQERATAEKACAGLVLGTFSHFMNSERAILNALQRAPLDYKQALDALPKTLRMMFLHAIQSFLWNKVSSFRIETLGPTVIVGDLVLQDEARVEQMPSTNNPDNNTSSAVPLVKLVTQDDIDHERYSLQDVVLPLIGSKTRDPAHICSNQFDLIMQELGITRQMLLQITNRDFHCVGDYRKIICQPIDVHHSTIQYSDPRQPLLETDLMKLHGIHTGSSVTMLPNNETNNNNSNKETEEQLLVAMIVSFTLPSSSYATILLRELMKRPTSTEYQSTLQLETKL